MQSGFYVTLSGQVALERRMTTIAANIANMNTAGYRAEEVTFSTLLSKADEKPVSYSSTGDSYISRRAGGITHTGNPLDVAVQGTGWLGMQTPAGTVYTRDGRMRMQPDGTLQTLDGFGVLDAGGSPILLETESGPPTIAADGMITQGGRQVGAIGLFNIDTGAKLSRYENSGVVPDKPATPILDFTANGMAQGFVEGANVNPVLEMAKLISVSRAFEQLNSAMSSSESSQKDAIKTLGGS